MPRPRTSLLASPSPPAVSWGARLSRVRPLMALATKSALKLDGYNSFASLELIGEPWSTTRNRPRSFSRHNWRPLASRNRS